MKIKVSRKWWLSLGVTVALLALVWAVSSALAQSPGGDSVVGPAAIYSQTWTFTYQGQLSENGTPANGTYDFAVDVYSHPTTPGSLVATCIDVGPGLGNYQVNDGLFTFHLLCNGDNSTVFTGGDRWLEVQVAPHGTGITTTLARQPIAPAPYAFSLFPGAVISGTATSATNVLQVNGTVASDSAVLAVNANGDGFAVRGYNTYDTGVRGDGAYAGVYGYSTDGAGGYGYSATGVGLKALSVSGNLIEAWDASPLDRRFVVTNGGYVYADGGYNCGLTDPNNQADDLTNDPCLKDQSSADFAEVLPTTDDPQPGDVLVVNPDGRLASSTELYQTNVVGVYSTNPSYVGGAANLGREGHAPLAVVGVVPVKASAENGSIQPGDLLTTSSTPGHAMRAERFVGGAIIGKALEPLDEGTAVIQMLVMLQ
jgi:hypothetical protein